MGDLFRVDNACNPMRNSNCLNRVYNSIFLCSFKSVSKYYRQSCKNFYSGCACLRALAAEKQKNLTASGKNLQIIIIVPFVVIKSNRRWRIAGTFVPCFCAGTVEYGSTLPHRTRRKTRHCRTLHPPGAIKSFYVFDKS